MFLVFLFYRPDWFGMLHSWSDNRKKSTLMLSVYEPNIAISWLGNLKNLGPSAELAANPYQYDQKEDAEETPFPVPPSRRRSYHLQPNIVWIKNVGLQVKTCASFSNLLCLDRCFVMKMKTSPQK